jgi:hypothetical protein
MGEIALQASTDQELVCNHVPNCAHQVTSVLVAQSAIRYKSVEKIRKEKDTHQIMLPKCIVHEVQSQFCKLVQGVIIPLHLISLVGEQTWDRPRMHTWINVVV